MNCMSFNTNVEQIVMQGREAALHLDELESRNANEQGVPANISVAIAPSLDTGAMDEDMPSADSTSESGGNYRVPGRR
jgi:hypothetical protein